MTDLIWFRAMNWIFMLLVLGFIKENTFKKLKTTQEKTCYIAATTLVGGIAGIAGGAFVAAGVLGLVLSLVS